MKKLLIATFAFAALSLSLAADQPDFGVKDGEGGGPKRLFGKDDDQKDRGGKGLRPEDENIKHDLGHETKVDSILASINGEPITLLDVLLETAREESRLAAIFTGERLYSETAKLRRKAVDDIIDRKLVYALYKEKPFDIDNQIVENMVDSIAQSMGDGSRKNLEKRSKSIGATIDDLKENAKEHIAVSILVSEYCDRQVYITPKEVFDFYQSHLQEWVEPDALELQLLLIRRDGGRSGLNAAEACSMIAKSLDGADENKFASLARNYSDGPNAANGGSMGAIERSKLRPEFDAALKDAKAGFQSGPNETPEGFYFVRVASVKPAATPLFEKVDRDIRRKLEHAAKELKRDQFIQQLKDKSIVRYYF